MSLENELQNARNLVAKFGKIGLNIIDLTLMDLGANRVEGLSGYIATFDSIEQVEKILIDSDWQDQLAALPRTAKDKDASVAVRLAIARCEGELSAYVRKNFRYSNPFEVKNVS